MFFKNKKDYQRPRMRQSNGGSGATRPVFSYHATAGRSDVGGGRRTPSPLWAASDKPAAERRKPAAWTRRVPIAAAIVLALAFLCSNLLLSGDPAVIPLVSGHDGKVFLRSVDTYEAAARSIMGSSWANGNKLTVDSAKISRTMRQQFPELADVSVSLPVVGRQAEIYIQPARPAVLLKTADASVYVVDTAGRALISASQVPKVEKLGLVLVEDQSGLEVALGDTIVPSDTIDFITEVAGQLKAKEIAITGVVLPRATSELDVRIEGAPYNVRFNLRGDARAEAGAFLAVKQQLEREGKTPSSYIDVRVDNKAFYR